MRRKAQQGGGIQVVAGAPTPQRRARRLPGQVAAALAVLLLWAFASGPQSRAQMAGPRTTLTPEQRAARFVAGRRTLPAGRRGSATGGAAAMAGARAASRAMPHNGENDDAVAGASVRGLRPRVLNTGLGAAWTPVGPAAVQSLRFGAISGRVTSMAVDPADGTGNTVYVGTAGGGVWKSTNATAPAAQVRFVPLTDDLPVFANSAGGSGIPSLSIGAMTTVPGGVLLAGTGDPNDSADSYYGTGLLRSTDGGLTWGLVTTTNDGVNGFHSFYGLGFAGFAVSSVTPQLVVAAVSQSGEGQLVSSAQSNSVMGLYYSTDAGATWQMATLFDNGQVLTGPSAASWQAGVAATSVVWNPVRQRFFAAVRYHGYYESTDGMNWTRMPGQPGSGLTTASCPRVAGPNPSCPIFRGTLAVNAVTGDLFALTTDISNTDQGLYQDVCATTGNGCASAEPTFAQRLPSAALEVGSGSTMIAQADYNASLLAVPVAAGSGGAADTALFAGTTDPFRCSLSAGCVLRNATNAVNGCNAPAGVGPAQHAIIADAAAGAGTAFFGNDSGLWRTTDLVNQQGTACAPDDAAHFQNLNANLGPLGEVAAVAEDPADATVVLAGLGGMGTIATAGSSATAWQQLSAAEGGGAAIDPNDSSRWYVSTGAGISVAACSNGAACTAADVATATPVGAAQMGGDVALLDAPWELDPQATGSLLAGTCRVWRGPAASAAGWGANDALSAIFTGPQGAACSANNGLVSALGAGGTQTGNGAGSTVLYAGMAGFQAGGGSVAPGHVFVQTQAGVVGAAWTDTSATRNVTNDARNNGAFNPGQFSITAATVDPHDATGKTVYVTVGGFSTSITSSPHIYRSTDAGAHWTSITANLPNAPANAVLVDPNDANTVYVAMDSGVYATSAVTTCAAQNCWSTLGTALPNAPVTSMVAGAGVPTPDGRLGMLRVGTFGRGVWQLPLLTAATAQRPAMVLTPGSLTFAQTSVGGTTAAQTVIVTNTGTAPLVISSLAITSSNPPVGVQTLVTDFVVATGTDACSGTTVAVGGTCAFGIVFAPSGTGARSSTLTVYGNVAGGQSTLALSGTAVIGPALTLTPTSLQFPLTTVGSRSAVQNVVLANTGGTTVSVGATSILGSDFVVTANSCGASLSTQNSCTISVAFAPAATGTRSGTLSVGTGVGTQTVSLLGTAQTPATDGLSATTINFATTPVGQKSVTAQLVLTNAGDQPLTLIATGSSSADFAVTNACGNSLAGHSACTIGVQFVPHSIGVSTTTLTVSDAFRSQAVTLTGTGIAPAGVSLLPGGTMGFGTVGVGQSSAAQTLTLTNNGGLPLVLSSVTLTGDFALGVGSSCGATVPVGQSCSLNVLFSPSVTGTRTGAITVADNAASGSQVVLLTGAGVDFQLALNSGSTSATVSGVNGSIAFPLMVSSSSGSTGTATLTCAGAPANASCLLSASTVQLGANTVVTATIATGAAATTSSSLRRPLVLGGVAFALLLPLLRIRRGALPRLMALLLVVAGFGLSGCGSVGRTLPGSATGGGGSGVAAPAGTYAVVVTAQSAGLSRSVTLTVVVQ